MKKLFNGCNYQRFDVQYKKLVKRIMKEGVWSDNRTSDKSKKVFGANLRIDLQKEFPLLTLKKTGIRNLTNEMLWIYQQQRNDVQWLRDRNCNIWNEWELEDGTIGKAYGYQVAKHDQMYQLILGLLTDPHSRRHIINLWQNEDLKEMSLTPCMMLTNWNVTDNKLNVHVFIRSSDVPLGLPYNVAQISVLTHMLAQVTGLQAGEVFISITDAHIYEQQYEAMQLLMKRKPTSVPQIQLNKSIEDFYEFTVDDVTITNYNPHGTIRMRVSV